MIKKLSLFFTLLSLQACSYLVSPIGGNFSEKPEEMEKKLSKEASELVDKIYAGFGSECFYDMHVHAVGNGSDGSENWITPEFENFFNFNKHMQFQVYKSATDIKDMKRTEQQYNQRVLSLLKGDKRYPQIFYLAFDYHYNESGQIDKDHSNFYIDNQYVWKMHKKHPEYILPAISIHPDRPNAIKDLKKWANKGVKVVKWLPNAMRIDPSSKSTDAFYKIMKKNDMILLSHVGEEKAVDGEAYQELGNPLLLKKALNLNLNVIMAHAGSRGKCIDYQNNNQQADCFDLFWRMFQNEKWKDNLYADTSGLTIHARVGKPLKVLLNHPEFHDRLIHGSDYPLPAINFIYRTSQLEDLGYITEGQRELLNEIYDYNPLTFEIALKRSLKHPETGKSFTDEAFKLPGKLCKIIEN